MDHKEEIKAMLVKAALDWLKDGDIERDIELLDKKLVINQYINAGYFLAKHQDNIVILHAWKSLNRDKVNISRETDFVVKSEDEMWIARHMFKTLMRRVD